MENRYTPSSRGGGDDEVEVFIVMSASIIPSSESREGVGAAENVVVQRK